MRENWQGARALTVLASAWLAMWVGGCGDAEQDPQPGGDNEAGTPADSATVPGDCGEGGTQVDDACVCKPGYIAGEKGCVRAKCDTPQGPAMSTVHQGAELRFTTASGDAVEVGYALGPGAAEPGAWVDGPGLRLTDKIGTGAVSVFARVKGKDCGKETWFSLTYNVQKAYAPAAGKEGSDAVAKDDGKIVGWATGYVEPVTYGKNVFDSWKKPEKALGPAEGTSTDIVCLGDGGSITLKFDPPIRDGEGADFAVFENSFDDGFLELGYVEVSTDGETFVRFGSAYLGNDPVGGFGKHDLTLIGGLAGRYRQGFGTPFDLGVLVNDPEVRRGKVRLSQIRYVRVVDIVGDGKSLDSFGHPIYDPHPTQQSAGFDLDAIAVLHH